MLEMEGIFSEIVVVAFDDEDDAQVVDVFIEGRRQWCDVAEWRCSERWRECSVEFCEIDTQSTRIARWVR